jgi:hypothetical protein
VGRRAAPPYGFQVRGTQTPPPRANPEEWIMAATAVTTLKVQNFETWKGRYDEGEAMRRSFHVRGVAVLRDATDPNVVTVLTRFDSVDAAKAMIASEKWKEASKGSGATPIEILFNDVVEEKSY